jgi:predicted DNA binding CopG/RHH family protein
MRKQYDFGAAQANPYAARVKKSITIRVDETSIAYFKSLSAETGIPYQSLINLYLNDCALSKRRIKLDWK